jgi:hypothetical protein
MRLSWLLALMALHTSLSAAEPTNLESRVERAEARARLEERLADLQALQAEIAKLEKLAGVGPRQLVIRVQLIELSLTKQRNSGVPIPTLDSPGDAGTNAATIASWVSDRCAKVLVDQTLTSIDGQRATKFQPAIMQYRAHSDTVRKTRSAPPPALTLSDEILVELTPTVQPDGMVMLTLDFAKGGAPESDSEAGRTRRGTQSYRSRSSISISPGTSVVVQSWNTHRTSTQARETLPFLRKVQTQVNEIQTMLLVTLEPDDHR